MPVKDVEITDPLGSVPASAPLESPSSLDRIIELTMDPNADPGEINRLIAAELARLIKKLAEVNADPTTAYTKTNVKDQIRSLRELSKTIIESENLSKKDNLNFDGPKFRFAVAQLMNFFKKAVTDAGHDESTANGIMRSYRTILASSEADLRKQIERIESFNDLDAPVQS